MVESRAGVKRLVEVKVPVPTLAIERTTAECQAAVMKFLEHLVPEWTAFREQFQERVRLAILDRFSANLRAERILEHSSTCRGVTVNFPCDVHRVAGSATKAYAVAESTVSGLVNLALTMEGAGSTETLRQILRAVFEEELQVIYEEPPEGEVLKHRIAVYNTFLPIPDDETEGPLMVKRFHSKVRMRRFVLSQLANSNLESHNIVHFCSFGCCQSLEQSKMDFRAKVVESLLPHKLPVLNRKSWTGYKAATSWTGLLQCHWNLLSKMVIRYTGRPQGAPLSYESDGDGDDLPPHHQPDRQRPPILDTCRN